jgi:general secretion pathway protein F
MSTSEFHYRAFDTEGRSSKGTIAATSAKEAAARLRESGLLPVKVSENDSSWFDRLLQSISRSTKLTITQKIAYMSDLHSLLRAGLPLDRSHLLMADGIGKRQVTALLRKITDDLAGGKSLSQCWENSGAQFTPMEIGMMAAAEKTGNLMAVLEQLSGILKQRKELTDKIISASIYPIFLVLMSVAAFAVIATVLVPTLVPLFEGNGSELPFIIRAALLMKGAFLDYLPLVLILILLIMVGARVVLQGEQSSRLKEQFLLKVPVFRMMQCARTAQQLSMGLKSGLPLQHALRLTVLSSSSVSVGWELRAAGDALANGASLSAALAQSRIFDRPALEMVKLAELSGSLEESFAHIAEHNETRSQGQIEKSLTLLTPILTLAMGLLIGGLIVSVMQSVLSVNDLAFQ